MQGMQMSQNRDADGNRSYLNICVGICVNYGIALASGELGSSGSGNDELPAAS